ncbi:MAG: hypothetical protein ABIT96_05070, partial [Ferruginibacter sp.]
MKIIFFSIFIAISIHGFSQHVTGEKFSPVYLPSLLKEGRFFLKIPTLTRDTLLGFCDTGGGYTAIYYSTIQKINLQSKISQVIIKGGKTNFIYAKDLIDSNIIPYPAIGNYYKSAIKDAFFEIPDTTEQMDLFTTYVPHDVFLGQFFFIKNSWTFDYLSGKLFYNTPLNYNTPGENIQSLGFKKDRQGNKRFGHASMQVVVDGEIINVLFDTGATLLLGENSEPVFGDKKATGGSFIAKSIFDTWHKQHPDWRVIEKAEITGADLIEVPLVRVGNLSAGPVWFAKRPDEVWSKGMIGTMDKVVKGAIGGSFLQYFKV